MTLYGVPIGDSEETGELIQFTGCGSVGGALKFVVYGVWGSALYQDCVITERCSITS